METLKTAPGKVGIPEKIPEVEKIDRNWVQSLCAFQLISIDLAVLSALLFTLSTSEYLSPKKPIAVAISLYFGLWGCVWLLQLALLRRRRKDFAYLSQWLLFFICGALVYWGSRTL